MRQANWYMTEGASPSRRRNNRSTSLREPCAVTREGQAKRRQRCVRAELLSVAKLHVWSAEALFAAEGNTGRDVMVSPEPDSTASKNSGTYARHIPGPGRSSGRPGGSLPGPRRKGVRLDQR